MTSAETAPSIERELHELLLRHMSALNARVISSRARQALEDSRGGSERVCAMVNSAARLFVAEATLPSLVQDVEKLLRSKNDGVRKELPILREDDLRVARLIVRDLCEQSGASSLTTQRVATAVSEVARNIVSYTPGGRMEFAVTAGKPARIRVLAEDRGKGIANIDEVLSGRYRSKTGLGKGLVGLKKLMDTVEIQTGPTGTRITFEATLT